MLGPSGKGRQNSNSKAFGAPSSSFWYIVSGSRIAAHLVLQRLGAFRALGFRDFGSTLRLLGLRFAQVFGARVCHLTFGPSPEQTWKLIWSNVHRAAVFVGPFLRLLRLFWGGQYSRTWCRVWGTGTLSGFASLVSRLQFM